MFLTSICFLFYPRTEAAACSSVSLPSLKVTPYLEAFPCTAAKAIRFENVAISFHYTIINS